MTNRFTATEKWDDRWFRSLSPEFKLAWLYVVDRCDNAGVIELDQELANFQIGCEIDWGMFLTECGDRIYEMGNGKWWIVKYIPYQVRGVLKGSCRPHQQIIGLLEQHGLLSEFFDHFPKGMERVSEPLAKVPEKKRTETNRTDSLRGARSFTPPTVDEVTAYCAERKNGIDAERFVAHYTSQGWKKSNGQPVKCWKSCVVTWEGRDRSEKPSRQTPEEKLPIATARRKR